MSRKSLIICLAVLAAMMLFVVLGVTFLYSGTDAKHDEYKVADNGQYLFHLFNKSINSSTILAKSFLRTNPSIYF